MDTQLEDYTARICVDCAMVWANGDTSNMTGERAAEVIAASELPKGAWVAVGDEDGFSWQGCEACGNELGGDRFTATVMVK